MERLKKIGLPGFLLMTLAISSCSSSSSLNREITGKYASFSENEYDYFKDTIEVKQTDDGNFDIRQLSNWSAAKEDDPERPNKNKKKGVWNNYGQGSINTATLQVSDKTLRITDPMTGAVRIWTFDLKKMTLIQMAKDGSTTTYFKIP